MFKKSMIVLHKKMYWELSVKLMIYQIMLKCVKTHESRLLYILPFTLLTVSFLECLYFSRSGMNATA